MALGGEHLAWLSNQPGNPGIPGLMFGDASFRTYYRVHFDKATRVLMHAPPEQEDLQGYIRLARQWRAHGITTPRVHATEPRLGLALLEDFGDTHLASVTRREQPGAYAAALQQMLAIAAAPTAGLQDFCKQIYADEMQLLPDWASRAFAGDWLDVRLWSQLVDALGERLADMPTRCTHRDFHSRNLMLLSRPTGPIGEQSNIPKPLSDTRLPDPRSSAHFRSTAVQPQPTTAQLPLQSTTVQPHLLSTQASGNRPGAMPYTVPGLCIGVLDFQDACRAPYCYDLVSLLYDAYLDLPPALVDHLCCSFASHWQQRDLQLDVHLVALQRLLKVYGIFCRLALRDHKTDYLACLPRVAAHLVHLGAWLTERQSWLAPHQRLLVQLQGQLV